MRVYGTPSTDIYLRENAIDAGRRFTPPPGPMVDPFDGSAVSWDQSPDIKVDIADEQGNVAPFSSTVDYTAGGAIDYLGFQALKLVNPRRKIAARVFIQVHNRGSRDATNIDVRAFFGDSTKGVPAIKKVDFWSNFPADPADTSVWHPLGASQRITRLRPGEPAIVMFNLTMPPDPSMTKMTIVALIGSSEDMAVKSETRLDLSVVVPANKYVAARTLSVDPPYMGWIRTLLQSLGVVKPQ